MEWLQICKGETNRLTKDEAINELNLLEMAVRTPKAAEAVRLATNALIECEKYHWIPVDERLPEDDLPEGSPCKQIKVLVITKGFFNDATGVRSQLRKYEADRGWIWTRTCNISHWMYLPDKPNKVVK